jgi:hypothetical protein
MKFTLRSLEFHKLTREDFEILRRASDVVQRASSFPGQYLDYLVALDGAEQGHVRVATIRIESNYGTS